MHSHSKSQYIEIPKPIYKKREIPAPPNSPEDQAIAKNIVHQNKFSTVFFSVANNSDGGEKPVVSSAKTPKC